jgi:hypothetical protein
MVGFDRSATLVSRSIEVVRTEPGAVNNCRVRIEELRVRREALVRGNGCALFKKLRYQPYAPAATMSPNRGAYQTGNPCARGDEYPLLHMASRIVSRSRTSNLAPENAAAMASTGTGRVGSLSPNTSSWVSFR